TGATVTLVQKNFEDLRNDFIAQVPTGEGPDITVGAHDWLGALVAAGVVDTIDLGDKASEFEQVALDAMTYDGQLYAMPYSLETIALVQNVDLVGAEAPA
ncbi:extracellular solute-binding protein, partial [Mycobacterium tuberculosis]|nr:extracellular solute-binding protein [Mycobacterium tuberculosis]